MTWLRWRSFPLRFSFFVQINMSCSDRPNSSIVISDVSIYLFVRLGLSWSSLNNIFILNATEITRVVDLTVFVFKCRLQKGQPIVDLTFIKCVDCWWGSLVWIAHLATLIWVGVGSWIVTWAVCVKSLFVLVRLNGTRKAFMLFWYVISLRTRSTILVTLTKCVSEIVLWILTWAFCITK